MIKLSNIFIGILISTMLFGCAATTTKPVCEWRNPEYQGGAFKNILIVGLAKKESPRRLFENTFVDSLKQEHADATASLTVLSGTSRPTKQEICDAVKKENFDAVLLTHMVSIGQEDVSPAPDASKSFYSYYLSVNDEALPSYTATSVKLQTCLYDVKTEKLVWRMQSATIDPGSKDALIKSEIKIIVGMLKKQQLLEASE